MPMTTTDVVIRVRLCKTAYVASLLLDELLASHVRCSVCGNWIEIDPRGDVLDSSGRCDECQP